MRWLAAAAAFFCATPAIAGEAALLTLKDAQTLAPADIAARSGALLTQSYAGKVFLRQIRLVEPNHLDEVWLTRDMQPLGRGLCAADTLDIHYTTPPGTNVTPTDMPSVPFEMRTARRYAVVGAVDGQFVVPGGAGYRDVDCGKADWPSQDGTFGADGDGTALFGMAMLSTAVARAGTPDRFDLTIHCDAKSDPCTDVSRELRILQLAQVVDIARCYTGRFPARMPFDCFIATMGAPMVAPPRGPAVFDGWALRLEKRGHSLDITFYREPHNPADDIEP